MHSPKQQQRMRAIATVLAIAAFVTTILLLVLGGPSLFRFLLLGGTFCNLYLMITLRRRARPVTG